MTFSSVELTMSLDDFSKRILDPAMSVLAANIEYDAMSMYKDVYNSTWTSAAAATYNGVLDNRTLIQRGLAPLGDRTANLNSQDMVDLVKDTKTLFQDSGQLSGQYKDGYMGRAAGFDFMENTLWPGHSRSAAASYVCNTSTGITSGSSTITISGGSGTPNTGDVFTIEGVYSVHPETKVSTGVLQQFVVITGSTTVPTVSPTPVTSGATQNVSIVSAGASKTVTFAGTASDTLTTSLLYHKDAFTFVTADLDLPKGMDFAAREVLDGISLRMIRGYDINNDMFVTRLDCLYGYKTLRPQWASRLHCN